MLGIQRTIVWRTLVVQAFASWRGGFSVWVIAVLMSLGSVFAGNSAAGADTGPQGESLVSDEPVGTYDSDSVATPYNDGEYTAPQQQRRSQSGNAWNNDGPGLNGRMGHTAFETFGRTESITHIEILPYTIVDDGMFFADLRGFVDNQSRLGGNAGFGYRRWLSDWERVLGASFWYDVDETSGSPFHDLGLSLETYGRHWDFRTNLYYPVGTDRKDYQIDLINSRFRGNQVLFDRHREFGEAMEGLDLEFGILLPTEFAEDHRLRAYAGWYHFNGDTAPDIDGYKVRLEGDLTENISAQVELTDDDTFGTNVTLGVVVGFSSSSAPRSPDPWSQVNLMRRFIQRNYNVIVSKQTELISGMAAVNPTTGLPYVVQHASSNPAGLNLGTLEHPFHAIGDAQTAGGDIVFVHADSVFNTPVVLAANDVLLGEGVDHTISVDQYGEQLLPTATAGVSLPMLQGVAGDAVTLANGTEFNGFTIDSPTGYGITGTTVGGSSVSNVSVLNSTLDGVFLQDPSSTMGFSNVQVAGSAGSAFHVDGGDADVTFSGTVNNTAGQTLHIENTTGGTVDLSGASVTDTGGTGLAITNADGDVTFGNVTVQNSTATGIDISGGAGTFTFSGNTTVENAASSGIDIQDTTGTVSFADVDVTSDGQTGLYVRNATTVNVTGGTLEATNGGAVADIDGAELDISLTSVSSDGGAFGLRIANSTGLFMVNGDGSMGTGGMIQNSTTAGVLLDNAGTVGFQYVDFDANNIAVQATGTERLALSQTRITNSTSYGVDSLNTQTLEVVASEITNNGGTSVRARADTLGTHSIQFVSNLVSEDTSGVLEAATLGAGDGSTLSLVFSGNVITTAGAGVSAVNLDWNGPLSVGIGSNMFGGTGGTSAGVNITASSTADHAEITIGQNTFSYDGGGDAGLRVTTLGPSSVNVTSNLIDFDGANSAGMDFTLAESAVVNLFNNIVTDNISGGTGILFSQIDGPSNVTIDSNRIYLLSTDAVLDRGIIFQAIDDTNGKVSLFGTQNNTVTAVSGATTMFFAPLGTTTGQFFLNGAAVP